MASPDIIDLDRLLAPISEESPAGKDIREDSSPTSHYQQIKTARSAARAAERKSVHDGNTAEADEHWRSILSLAPEILESQSKDLEIATWYTEALIRHHNFDGLRDAFKLINGLVETYWDNLHPMPDEDGMETRVSALAGLNGEGAEGVLIAPIRKVPITQGDHPAPFSLWQYQQALEVQRSADEETRAERAEKLGFTIDDIEKAVNESSDEFFVNQLDAIATAIEAYKNVSQTLDQHCSAHEAPPTRNIIEILEECRGAVNHIGQHKLPSQDSQEMDGESAESEAGPHTGSAPATQSGPIKSREQAFKQLTEISRFFRKTEPHSPVSYVLEKAVKWGNMSLNELVDELIPDSSSREHFSNITGVKGEES